jgi:hypothetical protein
VGTAVSVLIRRDPWRTWRCRYSFWGAAAGSLDLRAEEERLLGQLDECELELVRRAAAIVKGALPQG